ncbi:hypothetical protein BpHYR1_046475 [Brachionus plicatilis]|uniref:Uncharacterized protein n=1 Tax=Brachionus plicatilis TaxID=10195 RepID=A0A3M7PMH7_BRAPC|nr:hypothetical protein BpHYR1_046475 [Brachionus plicatilis]
MSKKSRTTGTAEYTRFGSTAVDSHLFFKAKSSIVSMALITALVIGKCAKIDGLDAFCKNLCHLFVYILLSVIITTNVNKTSIWSNISKRRSSIINKNKSLFRINFKVFDSNKMIENYLNFYLKFESIKF